MNIFSLLAFNVGANVGPLVGPTVGDRVGDGVTAHCEMPGHPSSFTHSSPVEMNYEKNIVLRII